MAWQQQQQQQPFVVVDPRLSAPRGEEYSISARQERQELLLEEIEDYHLPLGQSDASLDLDSLQQASTDRPINADNVGFKLLQKMGWKQGAGLGRNSDGIVEPVRGGVEMGVRLGLGKAEQEQWFMRADNVSRKRLEVEIQADEDEERAQRRQEQAEREARIRDEVSEMKRTFYCEMCNKQYNTAMELETHLSSYDHHHRKRMLETRALQHVRSRDERQRREQRQQEKEMQRLNQQFFKAQRSRQQQAGGPPPPPPDDPPPPPPMDAASPPPPPPPPSAAAGAGVWTQQHQEHQKQQHQGAPPPPPLPPSSASAAGGWGQQQEQQQEAPPPPAPLQLGGNTFTIKLGSMAASRGPAAATAAAGRIAGARRPPAAMFTAAAAKAKPAGLAPGAFGADSDEDEPGG